MANASMHLHTTPRIMSWVSLVACLLVVFVQFLVPSVDGATSYTVLYNAIKNKQASLTISGTVFLQGNLPPITHSMTIRGTSNAKIDGREWKYRIFVVQGSGARLVLSNVQLYKGQAPLKSSRPAKRFPPLADGGAVLLYGGASAEFRNVFFNHSKSWNGAAIALYGRSSIKVYNSRFLNNYAWYAGGGIFLAEGSKAWVYSSSFERNKGPDEGGAILVKGGSRFRSENTLYKRNTAKGEGGAGWLVEGAGSIAVSVRDTFFENKGTSSTDVGGAILVKESGKLYVFRSSFVRNVVRSGKGNTIFVDEGFIGLLCGSPRSIVEWPAGKPAPSIPTNCAMTLPSV